MFRVVYISTFAMVALALGGIRERCASRANLGTRAHIYHLGFATPIHIRSPLSLRNADVSSK